MAAAATSNLGRQVRTSDHDAHPGFAIPGVILDTSAPTVGGLVELRLLAVERASRGAGAGRRALDALCRQADAHGWTLTLSATGDFGADLGRLLGWYQRHGFVVDHTTRVAGTGDVPMTRRPRGQIDRAGTGPARVRSHT